MLSTLNRWILLLFISASVFENINSADNPTEDHDKHDQVQKKLLLILFDGFRWDYVTDSHSGFSKLKEKGVTAKYLEPAFPAMSFPNYYSVVTGLYVENHGMVMNYMYDTSRREFYKMLPDKGSSQSFWWEEAEPIWITATKKGLRTHLYLWPGGEIEIHGVKADYAIPYARQFGLDSFQQHINDALDKFKTDKADLVQVYCEHTDYVGHHDGPSSTQIVTAVQEIDVKIGELINSIHDLGLDDKVNVVIVSDHGMTRSDSSSAARIYLDRVARDILDDIYYVIGHGAVVGIFPKSKKAESIVRKLSLIKGIKAWKKEDIPEEFHIRNNYRTPPILVLAQKNYFIVGYRNETKQIPYFTHEPQFNGYHGYDPDEVDDMRGIFYAYGPEFEDNMKFPPIHMVDVYNMMMYSLDLNPLPNNGSWKSTFNMMRAKSGASSVFYEGISGVLACVGFVYMYSLLIFVHSVWM